MSYPTPHNSGTPEDFAKTVLMPGDPLRAKHVAEDFLTDAVLVNNVRGVQGYTGFWKGTRVSVMASGMGMPAIGIYSWELFNFYGVENIIRIGSAGALSDKLELMDVVAGQGACTDSNYLETFGTHGVYAPIADFELLYASVESAKALGVDLKVGNLLSLDHFYFPDGKDRYPEWKKLGVLACEMESAALYANAAYAGKRALCLCTISDHLFKSGRLTPEERQSSMNQMIEIALDTAVRMEEK